VSYETTSTSAGPCPCGRGSFTRHTESPNHSFGSCSFSFDLDCRHCETDYIVEHHFVYRRDTREALDKALAALRDSEKKLTLAIEAAIDLIVSQSAVSIREEHRMLTNAKVCFEGPRRYKRAREEGFPPSELCNCSPYTNLDWVTSRLPTGEVLVSLKQAMTAHDKNQKLHTKASRLHKPVITASSL
jgi:hypothetical protein